MQFLKLEDLKRQCIVDEDFHDDDEYLISLGDVAEQVVAQQIDNDLAVCLDSYGQLAAPLKHACLLIVDYLYAHRGSEQDVADLPAAYTYFCKLYRRFK